jgi:predicted AlkP superfamily pyrophosphatase or phosphodiesterase
MVGKKTTVRKGTVATSGLTAMWVSGLLLTAPMKPVHAAPVLMISVDGMRSHYVTQGKEHGMKLPTFERFMKEGSYAEGMRPPVPSISWPGAVTMMTGVSPAQHGVYSNQHFNPRNAASDIYWYAKDIKAKTLWDAAAEAGMVVANVDQLGTVGTTVIQYDIPRYQPSNKEVENYKATHAASRPASLLPELEATLGPYEGIHFDSKDYDRSRVRFAVEILRRHKPQFMTVHLSSVDVAGHNHGPFSEPLKRAMAAMDGLIGQLHDAAIAADPDTVVVVVSDHGMAPVNQALNLRVAFVKAGLITIDPPEAGRPVRVRDWKADVWSADSGSAAIILKDPSDTATRAKAAELLRSLAADPKNGIARIVEGADVQKSGGWPDASFIVGVNPGTMLSGAYVGELLTEGSLRGTHGHLPDRPEMYASTFIVGKGIRKGNNLGVGDLRQVTSTVARVLGVKLESANQPVLPVFDTSSAGKQGR